jgi:hypothetical protein
MSGFNIKLSTHIYNDINMKGIRNFSNCIDADLIGLCTHGRTGLAHFFSAGRLSKPCSKAGNHI